jgi:hypothetical protein
MKKILSRKTICLLIAAFFAVCFGVTASANESGDFTYAIRSDGTIAITAYIGNSPDVVIPDMIDDLGVTEIFSFSLGENVESLFIPSSVKKIEYNAFDYTTNISQITVDAQSPYFTTQDGILYNKKLTELIRCPVTYSGEINIPESVAQISDSAFSNCEEITKVNIPDSVSVISGEAFFGCSKLSEINLPNDFIELGDTVFADCTSLTSVTIPGKILYVGDSMFYGCSSLTDVVIEDGIVSIGNSAFAYCESLKNVTIPNSVTELGNNVFRSNSSLEEITLPEGVTCIGDYNFWYCSLLKTINFPASITSFGMQNFRFCENLTAINVTENNNVFCSIDGVLFDKSKTKIIVFPNGKSGEYKVPDGVKQIGDDSFIDTKKLTVIVFPETLETIGNNAFFLSGLTEIIVPESVKYIGTSAFSSCENLSLIRLPSGLVNIADYTLSGAYELKSITVPDGVAAIGEYAFADCLKLEEIVIPASVKYIGVEVFRNCDNLTIAGTAGSFIQEYAENTDIAFRVITTTEKTEAHEQAEQSEQSENGSDLKIVYIIIGCIAALGIGFIVGRLSKK